MVCSDQYCVCGLIDWWLSKKQLYFFTENAASKSFDIYGETATEMKGTATFAWVDCSSKEGKKVCFCNDA